LTSSHGFFPKIWLRLRCESHSEFNLHATLSSCVTISSYNTMPHCVGMSVYGASCPGWVPLLQGACSQTGKHIHGEKVRQKIATKTTPAEKGGHCPLVHTTLWWASHAFGKWAEWHDECIVGPEMGCEEDSDYHQVVGDGASGQVAGQFVKFEWLKVKFWQLRGQRSVQDPKDNQFNRCTPRVCTLASKAQGFW